MGLHDDMMAAVLGVHKEVHGGTALLHSDVQDTVGLTLVSLGPVQGSDDEGDEISRARRWREVVVAIADVPLDQAQEWTHMTVAGERWRITWPALRQDANTMTLRLTATAATAVQRPGYRARD